MMRVFLLGVGMSIAFAVIAWLFIRAAAAEEERARLDARRRMERLGIVHSHRRGTRFENERGDF